ncbi:MAG: 30S ribosomal protein S12 methylthiotransferase RimO [Acidimicrobiales bacterium]
MPKRYWLETLGCPKNQVDSDKLAGLLEAAGYEACRQPGQADLVVVNTCAFVEAAREESVGAVLDLAEAKKPGARLVVTGCMAQRYGQELADVLPEVDQVAGFGVPVQLGGRGQALGGRDGAASGPKLPALDLLNLPRPKGRAPWAYVKVAEGCDRRCGFCAIPQFRGPQRSRSLSAVLAEVDALEAKEVVLVAQDPVSWGKDRRPSGTSGAGGDLAELVRAVRAHTERVRALYLHPSGLSERLVEALGESGCPYFDLSLQHVSGSLLRRMRRPGDAERFRRVVADIRRRYPDAALRSSFVIGYPGETEEDHDQLLAFLADVQLDWAGFFAFSPEEGTYAAGLADQVPASLVAERLSECSELQDSITARRRSALVGTTCRALVDAPGLARSHREAPEIDGVIRVPRSLATGSWVEVQITAADGPDLVGALRRGQLSSTAGVLALSAHAGVTET